MTPSEIALINKKKYKPKKIDKKYLERREILTALEQLESCVSVYDSKEMSQANQNYRIIKDWIIAKTE